MSNCANISVGLVPLSDGIGLYPDGSNDIPAAHLASGIDIASTIVPLRPNGMPNPKGKMGLIAVGMSNTEQEFREFVLMSPSPNPKLVLVNGAQSGQEAFEWADPSNSCWTTLDNRVQQSGLTNNQIVAAWVKMANGTLTADPTADLKAQIVEIVKLLAVRFPSLKMVYLSSRTYAGYAVDAVVPEPYPYESGLAVRDVLADQFAGLLPFDGPNRIAPWLAWGPYLWADGLTPRGDGLVWECNDVQSDGIHPSPVGRAKVADMLVSFFTTHPTTAGWFNGVV